VSEVCNLFEPVPQLLKNVRYKSGAPLENILVKEAIKDGESRLGATGRIVVRKSGTEPLIRVMAEGDDMVLVEAVVDDITSAITQVAV